ncbi:MAG: RNA polymerase sigma factor [Bacteroidetes bacterium]|nr:RNA polymerase sigma factor [Bacteroidota bacterium]
MQNATYKCNKFYPILKGIDEQEFLKILEANQNLVHKVCSLYTSDRASRQDLFQEICVQLWKSYANFRGDSKFTTWMYRVALNTALSLHRKEKKFKQNTGIDFFIEKLEATPYDPTEAEQLKLLYKAIHELSDIDKALVFLYLEDKNYKEISEMMGISEVNARVKMNRIKKKLKTVLNP